MKIDLIVNFIIPDHSLHNRVHTRHSLVVSAFAMRSQGRGFESAALRSKKGGTMIRSNGSVKKVIEVNGKTGKFVHTKKQKCSETSQ